MLLNPISTFLQKVASYHANQKLVSPNGVNKARFSVISRFKLKLRVFLIGHTVVKVSYCVTKMITCSGTNDWTVF